MDVFNFYVSLIIYARVGLTLYHIACMPCLLVLRVIAKASGIGKISMGIYFNRLEQGMVRDPLMLDVWFLLHSGKGLISAVYLSVVVHPKT